MAKEPEDRGPAKEQRAAAAEPDQEAPGDKPAEDKPTDEPLDPDLAVDDTSALLNSVNTASGPARNAWIAFASLIAYLLVTIAGVTHVDLLLNSPVTLPIINVKIPLFSFFLFAPFLLLLVHLGLLVQHAMLAHKCRNFAEAIAAHETGRERSHPNRKLVHSYVFCQVLVGPTPPWPLQMLMRLMVYFTLILLPVLVLLHFQIKFLPSHDVVITHAHRMAIVLTVVLLLVMWPLIAIPDRALRKTVLSLGSKNWRWQTSFADLAISGVLSLAVVAFSLLVATIPQACFWPNEEQDETCFSLDRTTARWWPIMVGPANHSRAVFAPTKWLFEGNPDYTSGTLESAFSRNLVVTDKDLVATKDFEERETSLQLRGRNLRFAVLVRSDLHRADLFDSDLRGVRAKNARLDHASLEHAHLQGADLSEAIMEGANFSHASMHGVDLSRAKMHGANLTAAKLQGANVAEAKLQGANLYSAELWGANLILAEMQGASLAHAELRGADLTGAKMQGANLNEVQLRGADLRGARFWQTKAPFRSSLRLARPMEGDDIAPLSREGKRELEELITKTKDEALQDELKTRLAPLLDAEAEESCPKTGESQVWVAFSKSTEPDPAEFGDYLAELACGDRSGGYIIEKVAQRVEATNEDYAKFAAARLIDLETCPAAKHLSASMRASLENTAALVQTAPPPVPTK